MDSPLPDPNLLIPNLAALDALRFAGFVALAVWLPGWALSRLSGWRLADRFGQFALVNLLGILWSSWAFWGLLACGRASWLPAAAVLPAVIWIAARSARYRFAGAAWRSSWRGWTWWHAGGSALLAAVVLYQAFRVAGLAQYDDAGLRMYGSLYSDKLVGAFPCAALKEGVPPRNLRLSGHSIAYHYFPHLFVAMADVVAEVDVVDGFWIYAFAYGTLVNGAAVLAFCRRHSRSRGLALAGLVLFLAFTGGPEGKTLHLTTALLLLGLLAFERARLAGRWRWGVLAALLWGSMIGYEFYHAALTLAGLGVWWGAGSLAILARRPRWSRETIRRLAGHAMLAAPAVLVAVTVTSVLFLGARKVAPPSVVWENTYRRGYAREWRDWARDVPWTAPILEWKRGKPLSRAEAADFVPPTLLQRAFSGVVYEAGFVAFVALTYVSAGIFGGVYFWRRCSRIRQNSGDRRETCNLSEGPRTLASSATENGSAGDGLLAAIVAVGFVTPAIVTWGFQAGDVWIESPDVGRFPTYAMLLLLLCGLVPLAQALRQFARPRYWAPLALVLIGTCQAAWHDLGLTPMPLYHHVSGDKLAALYCLRTEVSVDEPVLHPWDDELIRDAHQGDAVSFTYKRHFTLGSNLVGRQMYFEGREEHLLANNPAEIYRRSALRKAFYRHEPQAVEELTAGGVDVIVADREHPAPPEVAAHWERLLDRADVQVYRRRESGLARR